MLDPDFVMLSDSEKWHLIGIWIIAADRNGVISDDPKVVKKLIAADVEPDLEKFLSLQLLENVKNKRRRRDAIVTPKCQPNDAPETETELIPPTPLKGDDISRVFEHWKTVMGHPRAKLGERGRKIRTKLADFTADQLCQAIDGCKASPFHMGENQDGTVHDELTMILRNTAQIEKFIGLASKPVSRDPIHQRFGVYG